MSKSGSKLTIRITIALTYALVNLEETSRGGSTSGGTRWRTQRNITELKPIGSSSRSRSKSTHPIHSRNPSRTSASTGSLRNSGQNRNLHLDISSSSSGSVGISSSDPVVEFEVMSIVVFGGVVTGVLESGEAPEGQGEDDEDGHDDAEACGDFVAHVFGVVEVWGCGWGFDV